jgi:N-acetylneuraminate synthase
MIEKHFTDDVTRNGPDHAFSMDPLTWRAMVDDTRLLEASLGNGVKGVEENEQKTVILQRRCVRTARPLAAGTVVQRSDLVVVRPAPAVAVPAHQIESVIGARLNRDLNAGEHLSWDDLKLND